MGLRRQASLIDRGSPRVRPACNHRPTDETQKVEIKVRRQTRRPFSAETAISHRPGPVASDHRVVQLPHSDARQRKVARPRPHAPEHHRRREHAHVEASAQRSSRAAPIKGSDQGDKNLTGVKRFGQRHASTQVADKSRCDAGTKPAPTTAKAESLTCDRCTPIFPPYALRPPHMSTTTIRLEDEFKARIAAAAARSGRSSHAFILEAVAEMVERSGLDEELHRLADRRWAALRRTGESVAWDDAKPCLQDRAADKKAHRPAARKSVP
ncbi:hypothetical protein VVAX_05928 [Variovorax paradoxus]|uniref:Uncharacterized protein n=2 Tax=Variovorax paradoxus TaxID=34073 RepID=A0A679JQS8_VARPD|nr:hypothetical protein VVAX_05928 [Variovorax paradoxus]